jgi:hypothetical protein
MVAVGNEVEVDDNGLILRGSVTGVSETGFMIRYQLKDSDANRVGSPSSYPAFLSKGGAYKRGKIVVRVVE